MHVHMYAQCLFSVMYELYALLFCITDLVQWCILLSAYMFLDLMLYYFGPAGDILNQELTYFATHSCVMLGVKKDIRDVRSKIRKMCIKPLRKHSTSNTYIIMS